MATITTPLENCRTEDDECAYITRLIQRYEERYNKAFYRTDDYIFENVIDITEDTSLVMNDDRSNVRKTSVLRSATPFDMTADLDSFLANELVPAPVHTIRDSSIDLDGCLHYESNTTNTDEYIGELDTLPCVYSR